VSWTRAEFKDGEVWAECDSSGALRQRGGKVRIAYQVRARKFYSTFADRLKVVDPTTVEEWETAPAKADGKASSSILGGSTADLDDPAHFHLWSDGACSGNPGPAGAGTVLIDGDERREWSTWLGEGTNNIAELVGVLQGLEGLPPGTDRTVVVHTDSQYSIGVLAKSWKAKANQELIGRIRAALAPLPRVVWHWVRGHEGVALNERCDELARQAIVRRASTVT
jgi:ribonuclease HI